GAPLAALVGVELTEFVDRRMLPQPVASGVTAAMLILGMISMREFRDFTFLWTNPPGSMSEARRLRQMIAFLKTKDVSHVYSMNGLLEWELMFYSDEQILARFQSASDRYPAYIVAVDRALADGKPIAIVGYMDESGAPGCWDVPICSGGLDTLVPNPESI